jgi:hypothetical protein
MYKLDWNLPNFLMCAEKKIISAAAVPWCNSNMKRKTFVCSCTILRKTHFTCNLLYTGWKNKKTWSWLFERSLFQYTAQMNRTQSEFGNNFCNLHQLFSLFSFHRKYFLRQINIGKRFLNALSTEQRIEWSEKKNNRNMTSLNPAGIRYNNSINRFYSSEGTEFHWCIKNSEKSLRV